MAPAPEAVEDTLEEEEEEGFEVIPETPSLFNSHLVVDQKVKMQRLWDPV